MAEKRRRTKAYLDDFKKTASGDYSYEGALYGMPEEGRKRILIRLWSFLCGIGVLLLLCGCIPAAGMDHSFWALLPYAADWIAFAFVCGSMYRMTAGGNPLREYVYEASVKKLPHRLRAMELCTALTIAGDVIYLIRNGFGGKVLYTGLFLFLEALIILLALAMDRQLLKMDWKLCDKQK